MASTIGVDVGTETPFKILTTDHQTTEIQTETLPSTFRSTDTTTLPTSPTIVSSNVETINPPQLQTTTVHTTSQGATEKSDIAPGSSSESTTSFLVPSTIGSDVETETTPPVLATTGLTNTDGRIGISEFTITTEQSVTSPGSTYSSITSTLSLSSDRSQGTTEEFGAGPASTFVSTTVSGGISTIETVVETQTSSQRLTTRFGTNESQTETQPTTVTNFDATGKSVTAPGATFGTIPTTMPTISSSDIETGTPPQLQTSTDRTTRQDEAEKP
ncbi:unnamed protein product, partial [Nesidiocoris tenuis]